MLFNGGLSRAILTILLSQILLMYSFHSLCLPITHSLTFFSLHIILIFLLNSLSKGVFLVVRVYGVYSWLSFYFNILISPIIPFKHFAILVDLIVSFHLPVSTLLELEISAPVYWLISFWIIVAVDRLNFQASLRRNWRSTEQ